MTQRAGTLRYVGPPRPGPLHHRPAWGNSSKQEPASQVNRGPKKQGRSDGSTQSMRLLLRPARCPLQFTNGVKNSEPKGLIFGIAAGMAVNCMLHGHTAGIMAIFFNQKLS